MKTITTILVFFFLVGSAFAQHTIQIDDGMGNYLLLATSPDLTGTNTLLLPNPPLVPMNSGFICEGWMNGQIPVWNTTEMMWAPLNPGAEHQILTIIGGVPAWADAAVASTPNLQDLSGTLDIPHGGSGKTTRNDALNAFLPDQTGNANKFLQTDGTNAIWVNQIGGSSGTVTSVGLSMPTEFTTGSAITTSGNLIASWASQTANKIFASPNGSSGTPSFRTLTTNDISAGMINYSKIQNVGANSILGNNTVSPAPIVELSSSQVKSLLSLNNVENTALSTWAGSANITTLGSVTSGTWNATAIGPTKGGTGQSAFTLGDILYSDASNSLTKLSGNTSTTKKFFTQTGTGSVSGSPVWSVIAAADIPIMVGSGVSHAPGAVPDPGSTSGTTKFLREDGTWVAPSGSSGTVTSVGLSMPAEFTTGSAITTSGNLTTSWASQTANKIFASPDGSSGTPGFRSLLANDIPAGLVNYSKIQNVAANSILGNNTSSPTSIIELSASQVKTLLSLNNVENTTLSTWTGSTNITTLGSITSGTWSATAIGPTKGGTGQSTFTLGDILYSDASNSLAKLPGNSTSTKKFLTQTGTGSISAAPGWNTIASADIPVMVASGASHAAGAVPDPGSTAGTTKFLREDGSWQVPAGGSGGVNYDVTTAQNTAATLTDYLFDVAYSATAANGNAAGALITSTALGTNSSGTGLTISATATGTGTSKGLDVTCIGGSNRIGLLLTDGHLQSKQTTAVTSATLTGAGTTATATLTGCTDIAGKITLVTQGAGRAAGDQIKITFNKAYATAPIVTITPGNNKAYLNGTYISAVTTTDFTIALGSAPGNPETQIFYYHVIETQ